MLDKFTSVDWLTQQALKWGELSTLCTAQTFTGLTEGYHYNKGNYCYWVDKDNYHVYETLRRTGWISVGWMFQANLRSKKVSWGTKFRRLFGSALIARNCFEWAYKYNRYGNPFDYTESHNEHSVVYFKFEGGQLVDAYIGTGPFTGPVVDATFFLLGFLLFD